MGAWRLVRSDPCIGGRLALVVRGGSVGGVAMLGPSAAVRCGRGSESLSLAASASASLGIFCAATTGAVAAGTGLSTEAGEAMQFVADACSPSFVTALSCDSGNVRSSGLISFAWRGSGSCSSFCGCCDVLLSGPNGACVVVLVASQPRVSP